LLEPYKKLIEKSDMKETQELFESNLDYKKIILRLYSYKRYYIVLAVLFLISTFLINRFATVKYKNNTTLYLSEKDKTGSLNSANDLFQSFGLFETTANIDNELEILKSFSLVKKVIQESDLKVSYFAYKNSSVSEFLYKTPFTRKSELYTQSPVEVIVDPSVPQATNLNFRLTFLSETEFLIEADGIEIPL